MATSATILIVEDEAIVALDIKNRLGRMEVVDGIRAVEQVLLRFALPIVFMTAGEDVNTRQSVEVSSPLALLAKPFDTQELLATVRRGLSGEV